MIEAPFAIQHTNLSLAWASLFVRTMAEEPGPTFLSIRDFDSNGLPSEVPGVRAAVDFALGMTTTSDDSDSPGEKRYKTVDENAYVLFPQAEWVASGERDRDRLYRWYRIMERRIHARGGSQYGTYFGRLTNFEGVRGGKAWPTNQVEHMIGLLARGVASGRRPRFSGLQMSILDPSKDHTGQPQRGFPCLQQVSLSVDGGDLALLAYYPRQSVFDRAYGNYLGLCHLGRFIAQSAGLRFVRMDCFIADPQLGKAPKRALSELQQVATAAIGDAG